MCFVVSAFGMSAGRWRHIDTEGGEIQVRLCDSQQASACESHVWISKILHVLAELQCVETGHSYNAPAPPPVCWRGVCVIDDSIPRLLYSCEILVHALQVMH